MQGEECDLGPNNSDQGACTSTCKHARCGDGLLHAGIEACDDGAANGDVPDGGSGCSSACTSLAVCGDGRLDSPPEECDDGNRLDDDDCTNSCLLAGDGASAPWGEDCRVDPSTLRRDPATGLDYYADMLRIIAQPALSREEEAAILAVPDVAALRCGRHWSRGDTTGHYRFRLQGPRELGQIEAIAAAARAIVPRAVTVPVLLRAPVALDGPPTDIESMRGRALAESHAVPRAYAYARAWGLDHPPEVVVTAMHDTGVCPSDACSTFRPGSLSAELLPLLPHYPAPALAGLVDIDKDRHGTIMGEFLANPSDGVLSVIYGFELGNGIVAGLHRGQHRGFTYLGPTTPADAYLTGRTIDWGELAIDNYLSACNARAAASNHSHGNPISLEQQRNPVLLKAEALGNRASKALQYHILGTCRETLWVFSAGNTHTDIGAHPYFADVRYYAGTADSMWGPPGREAPGNVVGVAALEDAYKLSPISNYGDGVRLAARGYHTSMAASMVTSAAALLVAVDSTPTAPGPPVGRGSALATLLERTGRAIDETPSRAIDVAAALLVNRAFEPTDWLPFITDRLVYAGQETLADARKPTTKIQGEHDERSEWRFDRPGRRIVLTDRGGESGGGKLSDQFPETAVPDRCGYEGAADCLFDQWKFTFASRYLGSEHWKAAIEAVSDSIDAARIIPVMTLRRTNASVELRGAMRIFGPMRWLGDTDEWTSVLTYCVRVSWDEESDARVRIPLAMHGVTGPLTGSGALHNARLRGRLRREYAPTAESTTSIPECDEAYTPGPDRPAFREALLAWEEVANAGIFNIEGGYDSYPDPRERAEGRLDVAFEDARCTVVEPGRRVDWGVEDGSMGEDPYDWDTLYLRADDSVDPGRTLAGSPQTIVRVGDVEGENRCRARAAGSIDWTTTRTFITRDSEGLDHTSPPLSRRIRWSIDEPVDWDPRSGVFPVPLQYTAVDDDEGEYYPVSSGSLEESLFQSSWMMLPDWVFRGMRSTRPIPEVSPLRMIDAVGFLPMPDKPGGGGYRYPVVEARLASP